MSESISLHTYAKLLSGKLLRFEEINLSKEIINLLLKNNTLQAIPSIKRTILRTQCLRCGNLQSKLFASISCKKCEKKHMYCRNCIEMGRIMECEDLYYWTGPAPVWDLLDNPCTWKGELTDAQARAANKIKQSIIKEDDELLVWAVAGAGKTEMLFPGITTALEAGKRVCIATPRTDVVRELKPRLQHAFKNVPIQTLYGGSKEKQDDAQLIIATTHQLLRFKDAFDVLIIDEIDAFPFSGDASLPFATYRSKKESGTTIYLTATPRKKHQKAIRKKKLAHVFVPTRYHGHPLPVPTLHLMPPLETKSIIESLPKVFHHWLEKRKHQDRQLLIFVPTIVLTKKIMDPLMHLLLSKGVIKHKSQLTSVHSEDEEREEKVNGFREKEITVIVTTTILERGVTFPSVDVVVLEAGHEIFDEAALVQIAGRAGRSADDPTGEVIFFHNGKTDAMMKAIIMIKKMNHRGVKNQ